MTESINCHDVKNSTFAEVNNLIVSSIEKRAQTDAHKDVIEQAQQPFIAESKSSTRINLPAPSTTNYLLSIAEAYEAIFTSLAGTVIDQLQSQTAMQRLDQTMGEIVLASTNAAITQQDATFKKMYAAQAQEQSEAEKAAHWGKFAQIFGIVLIVVMIGATIATSGATAPVDETILPESLELTNMTSTTSNISDTELTSSSESEMENQPLNNNEGKIPDGKMEIGSDEEEEESAMKKMDKMMEGTGNNNNYEQLDETQKTTEEKVEQSNSEVNKSNDNWRNGLHRLAKTCIGGAVGTINALPYYFQGRASLYQAKYSNQIAKLLEELGPSMGIMQSNNMYFQFYQQIVQRGSQNVQELATETIDVTQTLSSVMSAYKQISAGLAQSVQH